MKFYIYSHITDGRLILTDDYTKEEINDGILLQNIKNDIERFHLKRPVSVYDEYKKLIYVV